MSDLRGTFNGDKYRGGSLKVDDLNLTQAEKNKIKNPEESLNNDDYVLLLMKLKSGMVDEGEADDLLKVLNAKIHKNRNSRVDL